MLARGSAALGSQPQTIGQADTQLQRLRRDKWAAAAVLGVLLLQIVVFSGSWKNFFCGDSIFYLSRVLEPAKVRFLFTHYDAQGAYRPLTYVLFTWVLFPLSGLNPFGYHLATAAFAALNSLLFYCLVRRVLSGKAALAALFIFAIHGVQFYISYDDTFLPDMLMMFCCRTLGMLLSAGVPLLHAVHVTAELLPANQQEAVCASFDSHIRSGRRIGEALQSIGVTSTFLLQMISIGEEAGRLDATLEKAAQCYEKQLELEIA
jgi:hypothetical protein